ncbi:DUF2752 domain-containing protein [Treponema rectale]|uniref:DUF2752 domain-containing protein n=1 Tax=Treponema rectale TaxID=744512 RepID=A0A7M1XM26_9SPIR|nr:DUF2752 domain-containing protein [Treponema rectale]
MTCLNRFILNFPCPTCGVTHAMLSLLQGNLKQYFYFNAMALPMCIATVSFFLGIILKKRILKTASLSIFIINIPYYVFRLYNGLIPEY